LRKLIVGRRGLEYSVGKHWEIWASMLIVSSVYC